MVKLFVIVGTVVLSGAITRAEGSTPPAQQQDSSSVGIAPGQTAKLNVVYPTVPEPVLQPLCTVTLGIADDQGNVLKNQEFQISGGKTVSLSLDADTDLTSSQGHAQIRGLTQTPATSSGGGYCSLIPSLDIVDNATGKTTVHLETRVTFPPPTAIRVRYECYRICRPSKRAKIIA